MLAVAPRSLTVLDTGLLCHLVVDSPNLAHFTQVQG